MQSSDSSSPRTTKIRLRLGSRTWSGSSMFSTCVRPILPEFVILVTSFQTQLALDTHMVVTDTQTTAADTKVMVADAKTVVVDTQSMVADAKTVVVDTQSMVADIHRKVVLTGQETTSGQNNVGAACYSPTPECLRSSRRKPGQQY
jgi:hypothetical protein